MLLSVSIYLLSLSQDAYGYGNGAKNNSFMILVTGWMGVFMEFAGILEWFVNIFKHQTNEFIFGACFTWIANPFLFVSWFTLFKKQKLSFWTSAFATLLSLSFLLFNNILWDNEGNYRQITQIFLGYYLWLFSSLTMLTTNFAAYYLTKKREILPNSSITLT